MDEITEVKSEEEPFLSYQQSEAEPAPYIPPPDRTHEDPTLRAVPEPSAGVPAGTTAPKTQGIWDNVYSNAPGAVRPFPQKASTYRRLDPQQRLALARGENLNSGYPPRNAQEQQQPPANNVNLTGYQPLAAQQPAANTMTAVTTHNNIGAKPNNYKTLSTFTALFCCLPFGLAAFSYGKQVDLAWIAGNYELAQRNSKAALQWNIVAIVAGIIGLIVGVGGLVAYIVIRANIIQQQYE